MGHPKSANGPSIKKRLTFHIMYLTGHHSIKFYSYSPVHEHSGSFPNQIRSEEATTQIVVRGCHQNPTGGPFTGAGELRACGMAWIGRTPVPSSAGPWLSLSSRSSRKRSARVGVPLQHFFWPRKSCMQEMRQLQCQWTACLYHHQLMRSHRHWCVDHFESVDRSHG